MVRASLLILALLIAGGCRRAPSPEPPDQPRAEPDRLVELTGLYREQGGESRLCILGSRFGIVIRGQGEASCGGSGRALREAAGIRITMQGDSACGFTAQVSGRSLVFPAAVPTGCGYYCGTGATLAGVRLAQIGAGSNEAMKARDLTDEPLCEGQ
jgi:hypothetical protein